jgi:hypothetical protein
MREDSEAKKVSRKGAEGRRKERKGIFIGVHLLVSYLRALRAP